MCVCVCVCVRACVPACVRACVCVCWPSRCYIHPGILMCCVSSQRTIRNYSYIRRNNSPVYATTYLWRHWCQSIRKATRIYQCTYDVCAALLVNGYLTCAFRLSRFEIMVSEDYLYDNNWNETCQNVKCFSKVCTRMCQVLAVTQFTYLTVINIAGTGKWMHGNVANIPSNLTKMAVNTFIFYWNSGFRRFSLFE